MRPVRYLSLLLIVLSFHTTAGSAEPTAAEAGMAQTVEQIAAKVKPSVVVVSVSGRDDNEQGLGTGFVISADGLIATNLHVIGEARPVSVKFADGRRFPVTEVHATEKSMDLVIVRIEAKDLVPLELGDSDALQPGQAVVAVGNPLGLQHSVVAGVASEKREVDGKPVIQLAMPIERGNSGGPLFDLHGRVMGVITLKSLVTENLGFAVVINALKPMLEKPNPIPMSRWSTIGAIDEREWSIVFGGRWRQRAGRITVDLSEGAESIHDAQNSTVRNIGPGQPGDAPFPGLPGFPGNAGAGFGGRALCLSKSDLPEVPFEVSVSVRFLPDSGAAGLVFHADGGDRHYGFYPSSGKLRLTRFQGPDAFSWKVLEEFPHKAYRPGEWNVLKVRVEADGFQCFINDEPAVTSKDTGFTTGRVGLAKFRDTQAEFRHFRIGRDLPSSQPAAETAQRIRSTASSISVNGPVAGELVDQLLPDATSTSEVLRHESKQLELRAQKLKELAVAVHARRVQDELKTLFTGNSEQVDLLRAALLIARLDNEEVEVDSYLQAVERIVRDIRGELKADATEADRFAALNRHLFQELGFHGSRSHYYHRSNSYLNEVIDDREGLPITLSVLYIELARRLDLRVVGVPLPGHFVVRYEPKEGSPQLLDPFEQGQPMSHADVLKLVREQLEGPVSDEQLEAAARNFLQAAGSKAIVIRMLANLRNMAENDRDTEAVLRYLNAAVAIDADDLENRARRIDIEIRTDRLKEAIADIDWMLERRPEGLDVNRVSQLRADLAGKLQQDRASGGE